MEVPIRAIGALRTRVEIRTYPRDDESFRELVLTGLRRFDRVRHIAAVPGRLDVLLAEQYPAARSRYQDPLASTGLPVLYVFRDGALVSADGTPATDGAPHDGGTPGGVSSADHHPVMRRVEAYARTASGVGSE